MKNGINSIDTKVLNEKNLPKWVMRIEDCINNFHACTYVTEKMNSIAFLKKQDYKMQSIEGELKELHEIYNVAKVLGYGINSLSEVKLAIDLFECKLYSFRSSPIVVGGHVPAIDGKVKPACYKD